MKVIITMAGLGARFRRRGYTVEKYAIPFRGKTLFEWSMSSLLNFRDCEFIFVARRSPAVEAFIRMECRSLGFDCIRIKLLDTPTRGQAETAVLAAEFFESDDSVLIFNIDTHVCPEKLTPGLIRGNGWIPVFSAPGDRWSFAEARGGEVLRTSEKVRTSDNCCVGLYYFDSFRKFRDIVMARISSGSDGELYVAPLYNEFIGAGNKVYLHAVPSECVIVLGTPEDMEEAERMLDEKKGA